MPLTPHFSTDSHLGQHCGPQSSRKQRTWGARVPDKQSWPSAAQASMARAQYVPEPPQPSPPPPRPVQPVERPGPASPSRHTPREAVPITTKEGQEVRSPRGPPGISQPSEAGHTLNANAAQQVRACQRLHSAAANWQRPLQPALPSAPLPLLGSRDRVFFCVSEVPQPLPGPGGVRGAGAGGLSFNPGSATQGGRVTRDIFEPLWAHV